MIRVTTPASAPAGGSSNPDAAERVYWGDGGIGAAGGLALAILGVGRALAVSHRRPRGSRKPRR
jgi:hypothetical protein